MSISSLDRYRGVRCVRVGCLGDPPCLFGWVEVRRDAVENPSSPCAADSAEEHRGKDLALELEEKGYDWVKELAPV